MNQLVTPDLTVSGLPDYCLAYTENVFGAPHIEATAWLAWQAAQFKHEDRNLPDVAVPIWCEWYGTVEGVKDNYGHVAVWTGSEVYTNPLSGSGHKVFPSVAAMEAGYGVSFVGWSEDISTLRVAQEGDTMTKEQADKIALFARLLQFLSVDQANAFNTSDTSYILKDPWNNIGQLLEDIKNSPEWTKANEAKVAYEKGQSALFVPYAGPELFNKK